jgi:hypothetical protein
MLIAASELSLLIQKKAMPIPKWSKKLEQATAGNIHKIPEEHEQPVPGLVYRQEDDVLERSAIYTGAVIISKQEPAPYRKQCEDDAAAIEN